MLYGWPSNIRVAQLASEPFDGYALECMHRHEVHDRRPTPVFQTNWLGALVDPKILPLLADQGGELDRFPLPAN
ncbi:hypothetical protein [Burkholderia sp. RF4-BP95]|uniref:hypothetical protein n=1 Tax=Burkholderia sp. RF4-BP95 TaxID=1637845 RepID=UPI00211D1C99|nr:hypothetical protein [Burkholderia sp. RF4-BP95]